ncbi:hypothetical protein [Burkholderia gladioli]|uniref:hypothetical protein n=1 Tax=Burkholderia gladioli TaxID=28095 RepID=UPI00163EFFF7|nr:hypothetical protein [Burkholderia gladioli]
MKNTFLMLISTALMLFSVKVFADGDMTLSAKQIRRGCSVVVHKEYPPGVDPNINSASFDLQLLWNCDGAPTVKIGTIEAEGGGPEIVTVFYRPSEVVVLARWRSISPSADFQGDFRSVHFVLRRLESSQCSGLCRLSPRRLVMATMVCLMDDV